MPFKGILIFSSKFGTLSATEGAQDPGWLCIELRTLQLEEIMMKVLLAWARLSPPR
jgi:hypothetical protein